MVAPRSDSPHLSPEGRSEPPPLIAVTTSELRPSHPGTATPQGEPPQREMALGLKYLKAIELAGGIPVVIPPLAEESLEPLLDRVSGLCLSGGPDLDPLAYGERRHEQIGPTWQELDTFELAVARAADARRLPILAICRGLQVLNVARGGSLHQHLPDIAGSTINHRQSEPSGEPTHWVKLEQGSRLSQIMGSRQLQVNSFHHQAAAELGEALLVTGQAPDGTVESLEAADREFLLAVQWHAECLIERSDHAALFAALVEAAGRFENARLRFSSAAWGA